MIRKRHVYSVSTNHSYGSPDVIAIELEGFRKKMYEKGPVCKDMLVYAPGYSEYKEFADHWQNVKELIAEYSPCVKADSIRAVRLWKEFSKTNIKNAAVKALKFIDNDTIEGICGSDRYFRFVIKRGELTEISEIPDNNIERILKPAPKQLGNMPHYPGRQWKCDITCSCKWTYGSVLVGTADGFIAKVFPDGRVYSIGPAICQGPVRDICSDAERGIAYGVGGDAEDIGNVFKYTDDRGLIYLGCVSCDLPDDNIGTCANFVLSACSLSPDGTTLAVGACDRLASVYIYKMEE